MRLRLRLARRIARARRDRGAFPAWEATLLSFALLAIPAAAWLDGLYPRERAPDRAVRVERETASARGWVLARSSSPVPILRAASPFTLLAASGRVSAGACGASSSEKVAAIVAAELGRYPQELLEKAGMRRVVLCQRLEQERLRIPSLPNIEGALLLDIDAEGDGEDAYLRRLLHHEVYHFVDLADDGRVRDDVRWASLNPASFRYGDGGRSLRTPGAAAVDPGVPGFVTLYATSAIEEDKAEVFSLLVSSPRELETLASRDRVVRAKADEVRQRLERFWPGLPRALGAEP